MLLSTLALKRPASVLPHITEQPCFCLGLGRYTPLLGETKLRSLSSCGLSATSEAATCFPEIIVAFSGKRLEAVEVTTVPTASLPNSLPKSEGSFERLESSPLLLTLHELRREGAVRKSHEQMVYHLDLKILARWISRICPENEAHFMHFWYKT